MNTVQKFINAQLGNYVFSRYDTALSRLHCSKQDDFKSFQLEAAGSDDLTEGPPVFACKFAPENTGYEHLLALANEDGKICIQNTKTAPFERFVTNAHHNAIFDLEWMPGNMKLVTVSGDHTARLFDVSPASLIEERIFHGHFRSVKTVACRREDPAVFATGSRDGAIFVWDSRANPSQNYIQKPDRIIANPHSVNDTPTRFKFRKRLRRQYVHVPGTESVTGLAFQDDVTLISCGAGDGVIKIWDLRYYSHRRDPQPKYTIPYSGTMSHKGFSNLIVDKSGVKLYASCMDHTIYCYNVATYQPDPIMTFQGHQQSTFYVKSCLSSDGRYLISGSGDNNCYIWNTTREMPVVRLEGHTHEVTCVAWQSRNFEVVTCSDDLRHKIWRISDAACPEMRNCDAGNSETQNRARFVEDTAPASYTAADNYTGMDSYTATAGYTATASNTATAGYTATASYTATATATTPSRKRKQGMNTTPAEKKPVCERCQMRTPGSHSPHNCENCIFGRRSVKRTAQTQLTPSDVKRPQNSARSRLFDGEHDTNILATILEENSPNISNINTTPNIPNISNIRNINSSPTSPESLTANLPNFVMDGQAPHLRNYSPQKKKDKDWLTKIRIEQSLRCQMDELNNAPTSPKMAKFSPKYQLQSAGSAGKKCSKKLTMSGGGSADLNAVNKSPLLKYFLTSNAGK